MTTKETKPHYEEKNDWENDRKRTLRIQYLRVVDFLVYPIERIIEITKIRFDSHIYIEVKLPFFTCSIKLCITTMWIILLLLFCRI